MKELSIEEKARRFDEVLAMAKECITYIPDDAVNKYMLNMFPELKESEDERIRREITSILRNAYWTSNRDRFNELVAWLEKQGKKPQGKSALEAIKEEKVDNANKVEPKDYNSIDPHFGKPINKVEPQPAWSEEDEERIKNIISVLDVQACWDGATGKKGNPYQREIDWLKSLKDRHTWKPSNEQIEAFEHFVRSIGESGYASPYDNNTKLLYSLLEQIKKLREG